MFRFFKAALPLFLIAFILPACGADVEAEYPKDPRIERAEARGSLIGEGGFDLLGGGRASEEAMASPIGVNGFLWRATLDTLAFMPLASADPFGGTIITEWYEDPNAPGERYKVNAVILDKALRADGVRITVFKQKMMSGSWRDQQLDESLSRRLEDTILTRARELRIAQLGR